MPEATRELLRELAAPLRAGRLRQRPARAGRPAGRRTGRARLLGQPRLRAAAPRRERAPPRSLPGRPRRGRPRVRRRTRPAHLERAGIRTEDKGAIVALHWRGAENEGEAESLASEIAADADWKGLVAHRGRKVLEIRPNVAINKGIAVAALIPARPVKAALYGGDDRTDVDAFAALRALEEDGDLEATACVAVASDEAPPEVTESADLTVDGPGFVKVLEALASDRTRGRARLSRGLLRPAADDGAARRRRGDRARRGDGDRRRPRRRHPHALSSPRAGGPSRSRSGSSSAARRERPRRCARCSPPRGRPRPCRRPRPSGGRLWRGSGRSAPSPSSRAASASSFRASPRSAPASPSPRRWPGGRASGAVAAIEERDGVRFYVEPGSALEPVTLVRTPGLRRDRPPPGHPPPPAPAPEL